MDENSVDRKLRAILSADVKGYSRLMGEDEVGTYQTLTSYLESIRSIISEHKGRVFSSPGDAVMAEFSSVIDAVQCAVELQEKIEAANADVPEDRKMQFRIGVNLGDVIKNGEQVYGDGVNIAARIETLAEPGRVSISQNVYNQVRNKLEFGYEFQGEQEVKNIADPVRVYKVLTEPENAGKLIGEKKAPKRPSKKPYIPILAILVLVVTATIWHFYPRAPDMEPASVENMAYPLPEKPSIAVLPFDNMSDDPKQQYLCDGLTEDIITALSKTPKMLVIARNSTFTYKAKPVKIQQVAQELGVRYVLEGSIQREEDKIRINAQLVDALNGTHLWAERYDREFRGLFAVQDDITKQIITALQLKLTMGENARMYARGTNSLEAYLKILQAREHHMRFTTEDNHISRSLAEKAISIDPNFGQAYLLVAATHMMDVWLQATDSPKQSMGKALEYANKAVSFNGADSHALLGFLYAMTKQYDKALTECSLSVDQDPNNASARTFYGLVLNSVGRSEEAIHQLEKAIRVDPFSTSFQLRTLGFAYSLQGQHEQAVNTCQKAVLKSPNDLLSHIFLTHAYGAAGRMEEAKNEAEAVLKINPKFSLEPFAKQLITRDPAELNKIIETLHAAGLPEHPAPPLPDKLSIAVLPFENMSGNPEQEYFSDGITEHIITSLSKVPYIFVIARNSTFSYKGKPVKIEQIAKELGVRYVLEGSVQRSDDRVRITVQLIDGTTGHHLWAENYDRKLNDVFALQDEIAMKVMIELQVKLTKADMGRLSPIKTTNIRAYEKYLKGVEYYLRRTDAGLIEARRFAKEGIALDPEYGAAYLLLGWTHLDDIWFHRTKDRAKSIQTAEELVQKAIDSSGQDATTHRLLSCVFMMKGQYEKAIVEAQKAVELSPNSATSNLVYGMVLGNADRYDEAIPVLKKAIRLDPVTPINYLNNLAWAYLYTEQYEKAIPLWNRTIERNPDYLFAYQGLTIAYQLSGNDIKAREAAVEVLRIKPTFSISKTELAKRTDFKNKKKRDRILEAYRKAGIPE